MKSFREYLIFERSREGKVGCPLPAAGVPEADPATSLGALCREDIENFPELSEVEVVRHFTRLSQWNHGLDDGMYPLGSCTMKHNPRSNEVMASLPGFTQAHPLMPDSAVQGCLRLMKQLEEALCQITGLPGCSLQPAAGAHGEFAGMLAIKALLNKKGENRPTVLVPDSAHGTNPATAAMCGFEVREVASDATGRIDLAKLESMVGADTAAMMITNPNTLGIFEKDIHLIALILHRHGAYLYMDGANMNALVGKVRPAEMGVDVLHLNLHKTFSTPHGGGGPGAGPICVQSELIPFLPRPFILRAADGRLRLDWQGSDSLGKVHGFHGQFGVLVRALSWILTLGGEGLIAHTEHAVLNNNYLRKMLEPHFHLPFAAPTLHETVFTDKLQAAAGVSTMDIAKNLLDYGFHPPTVYFPLVVSGAMMIEPTETESRGELNRFARAMIEIAELAREAPDQAHAAPHKTEIQRPDETNAARNPILRWTPQLPQK